MKRKRGSIITTQGSGLPNLNTQRTKMCKSVTELIHCYYRYYEKGKILCVGEKPDFIPKNKIFTQREWRSWLGKSKSNNLILEGSDTG